MKIWILFCGLPAARRPARPPGRPAARPPVDQPGAPAAQPYAIGNQLDKRKALSARRHLVYGAPFGTSVAGVKPRTILTIVRALTNGKRLTKGTTVTADKSAPPERTGRILKHLIVDTVVTIANIARFGNVDITGAIRTSDKTLLSDTGAKRDTKTATCILGTIGIILQSAAFLLTATDNPVDQTLPIVRISVARHNHFKRHT
jgi:hypothetical protein